MSETDSVTPATDPPERKITVSAERLAGWVDRYAQRHGSPIVQTCGQGWELVSPDGAVALLHDRWGGLDSDDVDEVITHLIRARRLGLVLVRKSAHAVGISDGPALVESKVDTHYVQGRTKAGGWSQQRYARRRDNQASKAFAEAAHEVARRLLPELESLEAIVCGGDSHGIREVFADPRLEPLIGLKTAHVLPTRDPRKAVLEAFVDQARAVTIELNQWA